MINDWNTMIRELPEPYQDLDFFYREPGWAMAEHDHKYYQVILMMNGILNLTVGDQTYPLTRGQICIIPPLQNHSLLTEGGYYQIGINLLVHEDPRGMIGLLRDYVRSFIVLDMPKFLDLLPILEKNCFELTKLSKMKIAGTLDHILTECIEATLAGTEMDFRNQLITLLNSHLNRKLTLSDIARRMSLSESHLERIVNQKFGCGVIDLFNQLRINKACSLLTNSSLRIESISEQLGFYDTAHFSNFFKKKTSMSPKQYREYKRLLL